jgi:hypothetical protein
MVGSAVAQPVLVLTVLAVALPPTLFQAGGHAQAQELPTIREATAHMESQDGFIPIHYDPRDGRLFLEVSLPGEEFFYHSFMASGVGLALARGLPNGMASERVVRFERRGPQVVLVARNIWAQFVDPERTDLPARVREQFRIFLRQSFPIVAEEDGRVLVDGTDHFLQDVHGAPRQFIVGVPGRLAAYFGEEGFSIDLKRSSIYHPGTRATPKSTEVEALLTFVTDEPGEWAVNSLSDSTTLVVRERHSLTGLPGPGFTVRRADPRMGFNPYPFLNPNATSGADRRMGGVCRWRLEKRDSTASVSEVVEPIIVYLDSAIPDGVREAAWRGFEYWGRVFENAGFRNAIRIRDLPPDADPLDPQFPIVVLWWPEGRFSSGHPVVDTRTGEIVKAVILLAGHQERFELNVYRAFQPLLEAGQPDLETYLIALRTWIVAHEAGHALAFMLHNSGVPSVMALLRPRLRVGESGRIEIDNSLLVPPDPHPYDEWMIRYAYTPLDPDGEQEGLRHIVEEGLDKRLRFASYSPANPSVGRIHFDDPLTVLEEDMSVRRVLLDRFGPNMLEPDEPPSLLFERLIPVYFHHRHSLGAVARVVGGVDSVYDLEGDYQGLERVIDSRAQRRALGALLNALSPEELLIPPRITTIIPPRLESSPVSELEWPARRPGVFMYTTDAGPLLLPLSTEDVFDPTGWAQVLSDLIVSELLNHERLARMAAHHASGQSDLSAHEVVDRIIEGSWEAPTPEDPALAPLRRIVRDAVLDALIAATQDEDLSSEVRQSVSAVLQGLLQEIRARGTVDPAERAHLDAAVRRIAEVF